MVDKSKKGDIVDVENEEAEPRSLRNFPPLSSYEPVPPFTEALEETRELQQDRDMHDIFNNFMVNIPLLNLIKNISRLSNFLRSFAPLKGRVN